jgi:ABC-type glycerol-3-phosphate transport system permease component
MSQVTHDIAEPIRPATKMRRPPKRRREDGAPPPLGAAGLAMHLLLILVALLCMLPFLWLIAATFKINLDMFRFMFLPYGTPDAETARALGKAQTVFATRLTFDNYIALFTTKPFARWLLNSIFLSSAHTVIVVTLSCLGGFALAKYTFAGKRLLMLLMLATMVIPGQVLLPSSYELMRALGWLNSYLAILVPGAVSVFGMFLFMQAMKAVPDELLQSGRIDGCSELRLWWEVALPIVRPMVGAFTLLTFMGSWNSFLWPQIVLQNPDKYTLPVGLSSLIGLPTDETPYGLLMAGTLLSVLPVVVLFFVLQRDFIAGLASGAVKG